MELKFISQIRKGNNKGTGLVYLPKNKIDSFSLDDWVQVEILENKFFAKIIFYSGKLGIYILKHIVIKNNLINKKAKIQIEKVGGFYTKMYSDGRIYIPKDIVKRQKLNHNDIVLIKGIENDKVVYERFSKVCGTKRKNRPTEYHCVFDKIFRDKELLFKIEKYSDRVDKENLNPLTIQLLNRMQYAFINNDWVIVFKGNKVPAIVNTDFKLSDLAFYLGAYFADGTKKGNSWAICASTFEQAKYYLKIHNLLIKDSKPEFTISYTNIYKINLDRLKKSLTETWRNKTGIQIDKFRIRKTTGKSISKWNKYGTLVIREHRQILLDIYNFLLQELIRKILSQENKKLAFNFLCGVMEGDGCASAKKRGHVMIFTNKDGVDILRNISNIAQIKFKINKEGKDNYNLRIGALEILRNFSYLKDKIFSLYPKRKKALFERLQLIKTVRFLLEKYEPNLGIKAWLRSNGFCDKNYKITDKGLRLGSELTANINKAITYG